MDRMSSAGGARGLAATATRAAGGAHPRADERTPAVDPDRMLAGGGEMGQRVRTFDWGATPLGPIAGWSPSVLTAVSLCLASRFPIILWLGPELVVLYNDAYIPIFAGKHPRPLGRPGLSADAWGEVADVIGPALRSVLERGEATWEDDQLLLLERSGYVEEAYFTYSYSPIREVGTGVAGVFAAVHETTARVLGERRLRTLRELGAHAAEAKTVADACARAAGILDANLADIPYSALYLLDDDGRRAHRAATSGMADGVPAAFPATLALDDDPTPWRLGAACAAGTPLVVDGIRDAVRALRAGPWPEPPARALVLPLAAVGTEHATAVLVACINPRRALDDDYRSFFDLVASQLLSAITNARAYEAERTRAEALAELDRAKTAFFSNVSHEFRTPLTLILGPVEDGLREAGTTARERERLEVVHRNGVRLLRLTNTLLDFSRIEAGRVEAVFEATDLAACTAELASVFRSAIERGGLALEVDCPPLPAPVWVDREMWEKIVFNLLSNAFKFTFEGGIRVAVRAAGDAVALEVADTGVGIAPEDVPHVFERFHRVRGARSRTYEGTGIGLALVAELVKLHGGAVAVASEPGRGSTFTVTLRQGTAHLPADRIGAQRRLASTALRGESYVEEALRWLPGEPAAAEEPASATDVAVSTAGARVLLADDNADMRDYVRRLLARHWTVEAVADGAAALAAARARPPDLVITDVMMPGLDGYELLRALRADARTQGVPVILLSARAGEESRVEGLAVGADDYLVKPFSARELVARVNAHLDLARRRHDAEARLRAEQARLELALGVGQIGTWDVDLVRGEALASGGRPGAPGLAPHPAGEGLELWLRHVHPDDRAPVEAAIRRAREGGEEYRSLHRVVDADGTVRWLEVRGQFLFDAVGTPVRFTGAFVDMTARHRLEQRLMAQLTVSRVLSEATDVAEASARMLDALLEHLDWHVAQAWLVEADGASVRCEQTRHRGPRAADFERASHDVRFPRGVGLPGRAWDTATAHWIPVVADDDNFPRRPHAQADGLESGVAFPVILAGTVVGVVELFARDRRVPDAELLATLAGIGRQLGQFIERVRAEEALRTSEGELADFFDSATIGLHWVGPDGTILRANQAELAMLGYTADEYIGHHIAEFHADRNVIDDILVRLTGGERLHDYPARLRAKDGSVRHVSIASSVLRDADGRFVHTRCFTRDVTERRAAEEEQRRLVAALQEADRRKDEFLAMLAHELRNPLAPIRNAVQILRHPVAEPYATEARDIIDRQVSHMARLLDDLLDVSRITRGKVVLRKEPVRVADVVREAVETSRGLIERRGLELVVAPVPETLRVLGDPVRLCQVVTNLVNNAARYTEAPGRIELAAEARGGDAVLRVRDTGIGIEPDAIEHIFDLFVQGPRTIDRGPGGLGIGLTLVRSLVELHGGGVRATSAGAGRGSEFVVTLPALAPGAAAAPDGSDAAPEAAPRGLRILVVEDNVDAARSLRMLLELGGHAVRVASDGTAALAQAPAHPADVALVDLGLPGIDGFEVARRLRAVPGWADAVLVAVSGYGRSEDKARARAAGFDEHFTKPIDLAALERTLGRLAERAR